MARRKTRYTGVYERQSTNSKYQGKPDVAYDFCYRDGRKLIWECAGWRSEGMTPQEAADLRHEAIKKAQKNPQGKSMTFAQAWEIYLRDWLQAEGKACTAGDISLYENYLRRLLSNILLSDIGPMQIRAVLTDMGSLSSQTKKHALGLVRRIYKKMISWQLYEGSVPTEGMIPKKVDNERLRFLTQTEARLLLAELDKRSSEFADICRVSLYAGLRLGEIFALQVQHIHLDVAIIDVMDAKAGTRQAFINAELAPVLAKYVEDKRPESYVFTQSDGISQMKYINNAFTRAVKRLGFNEGVEDGRLKVVFHTLRHTFASWLVQKGVPLYTVADLMGHSTIAMTKRYAKLADDDRRAAIAKLQGLL